MTTYYVSETGNDKNNGLQQGSAFQTLQQAGDLVKAGDTVYVMNGTYTSIYAHILSIANKQGTADAPITFMALPGQTPVLQAKGNNWNAISITGSTYITIEGLTLVGNRDNVTLAYALEQKDNLNNSATSGNGINITYSDDNENQLSTHITIKNNNVSNFPGGGIATTKADYITIENNVVSGNSWYSPFGTQGITMVNLANSDNNTTDYKVIIQGNTSFDNKQLVPWYVAGKITEGHGIMLDTSYVGGVAYTGKVLISNNLTYNNGGAGIQILKGENPVDIVNNTIYQNSQVVTYGEIFLNSAKNVRVYNNILYGSQGESVISNNKSDLLTFENNLAYNGVFNVTGSGNILNQDPLFVDAANGDFRLKPGSAAIDAGSSLFNGISTNIPQDGDGNGAALIDIGAYEAPRSTIATPEIQVLNGTVDIVDNSTTAINFGEIIVGNTLTKTFTIKNTGIATLNLSNLQLPNGFSLVGTLPTSIAVNASTTISIVLNPTTVGTYSGTLSLNNNDINESPFNFVISGTVKPVPVPEIQVLNGTANIVDGSTNAINFGNIILGNTLTKTFTIKNTGTAALNLSNLQLPDGFSLVGTLPTSVAPNASTTISVALSATTVGTYSGSLILNNNDTNESPFDFVISGRVNPVPVPEIQVLNGTANIADGSSAAINFGEIIVGNTLTKTFTIKNTGTAALNLSDLQLPDGFSLVGTLPTSVAPYASTTISVALDATTVGTYSGSLILNNNDSDESPFDFAISGTVKPVPVPEIQVLNGTVDIADGSTTAINFGNTTVGDILTKTFTINNTGTAALNLSNLKLPNGFSLVGTVPTSVAANASTTISVALSATTPGNYSGSLSLNNNDSNENPFDFAISGILKPAPTSAIQVLKGTDHNDTFTIRRGNGNYSIADFGGVGTNSNPSAAVIAKVDTLQFIGPDLTARNLQLTQNGNNLEVSFEGVGNTKVTLQNFNLENLENLAASTTRPAIGNILFDGEASVSKSFDVINANYTPTYISTANSVTFLNNLNNNISGYYNSNDVINGQGGNDTINGSGGDDLLRGGAGNDLLIGGPGNDILVGGTGADSFLYNTNAPFTSAAVGIDTITDFNHSQGDKIILAKNTFSAITSVVGKGFSNASDFQISSLGALSNAVIVYDSVTGQLLYNQNGSAAGLGSGGQFAQLTGAPTLTASDFIIQA
ncbi:MAG: choice-of-anchor D domain-containing protein [Nostoc sp.]|uniref:beta strand repeat-containing protein n=1 Tax=Nostoc sp. TaxID=1180 RepID=UPI002FF69641